MAQRVRRRQDDHRAARPPDSPLRHRREWQRQLALQKPRRRSHSPRSPRLRNPGQLRRGERYRQNPPLKGVKIGRRYGVKFERRLTAWSFAPGADWAILEEYYKEWLASRYDKFGMDPGVA